MDQRIRPIKVLSLFDGMSCGQIALRELRVPIERYYASEIDKFAIQQTQLNFPDTVQLGDVRNIDVDKLCDEVGEFDLLLAGSPCQSFSFAGKRVGMKTKENMEILTLGQYLDLKEADFEFEGQSYLFWEFMRVLTALRRRNPNIMFLLENVEMGKKWETVLSEAIGIHGVHINSALVSAQNRKRIYWSNIRVREEGMFGWRYTDIPQPEDRGIFLKDILESEVDEKYYLKDGVVINLIEYTIRNKQNGNGFRAIFHDMDGKMSTIKIGGRGKDDLVKVAAGAIRGRYTENGEVRQRFEPAPQEDKSNCVTTVEKDNVLLELSPNRHLQKNLTDVNEKAQTFLATSGKGAWANGMTLVEKGYRIRRITPTEAARLQTIPECYHWTCSETQQYRMLGNGWCVEVIKHILSFMNIG